MENKGLFKKINSLEIIKKIVGIAILCGTLPFGITALCLGKIADAWISLIINTYYSGSLMKAGFLVQMKFMMPTFLNSLAMGAIILGVIHLLPENLYSLQIGVGFVVGTTYYLLINWLFNKEKMSEMLDLLKRKK